jgi:CMP-N,N'-diacetyllegionaminic acid synthase
MQDKIIAIIPARAGSKGVKDKNIKPLCGHPLIAYSIMAARRSQYIDQVIVSTDSQEYIAVAKKYGALAPFLRPVNISTDDASDLAVMLHFLDWCKKNNIKLPDYIVHLRPTTPLRDPALIDEAIATIKAKHEKCTTLRSVHEMSETAYKCFELEDLYLKQVGNGSFDIEKANEARQSFPKTYHANGYVDILKTDFMLQHNKIHGDKALAYLTPNSAEIDIEDDFAYLQFQIERNQKLVNNLFGS